MRKFALALIASFGFIQAAQAIPSPLTQSIFYYDAIFSSPLFLETVTQNEFVVDVKRKTRDLNAETAIYEVRTRSGSTDDNIIVDAEDYDTHCFPWGRHGENLYIVEIAVTPNPQIGPPILTVVDVEAVSFKRHKFFRNDAE